jgi:hypothetical protein
LFAAFMKNGRLPNTKNNLGNKAQVKVKGRTIPESGCEGP